jgi:hypothetical protein
LKDSYKMIPTFGFHVGGHLAFKVRNNVEEPNRFQFGLNFVAGMVLEPAFAAANIIYDPL